MKSYRIFAALLASVALAACDKNAAQDITGTPPASAIKSFNFAPGAPSVNFYANEQKLTAITTSSCSSSSTGGTTDTTCLNGGKESTTGTAYGAAGSGAYYVGVAPGQYTLSGRITATTDKGLPISNTAATIESGKYYSYFLSGIYNTTSKTTDAFVIQDAFPVVSPADTFAYVRFVNAVSNAQPMALVIKSQTDSTKAEVPVGSAVAYKAGGDFVKLPSDIYTLTTRYAGSGNNVITRKDVSFLPGRVYTITAYGDITASSGTNVAKLDNTLNR